MKKYLLITLSVVLIVSSIVCTSHNDINAASKTSKVSLSKKKITVYEGKKKTIKLKKVNKKVTWKVKNKKIAKIVSRKGKYKNKVVIKGKKKGTTKLVAKYRGKTFVAKINVKKKETTVIPSINDKTSTEKITDIVEETTKQSTGIETTEDNRDAVEMKVSYNNQKINVKITNYTNDLIHTTYEIGKIEKYVDGQWINGIPDGSTGTCIEPICLLEYKNTFEFSIGLDGNGDSFIILSEPLESGHYRYSHKVYNGSEQIVITGEFDIN